MHNNIKINVRSTRGILNTYEISAEKKSPFILGLPAKGKLNIELIDETTGLAPQVVSLKRVGKDLVLIFSGSETEDIIIKGFYDNDEVSVIGRAENGQYYEYIPLTGDSKDAPAELAEGAESEVALGGEGHTSANPTENNENDFAWLPLLLAGAGGLAAAGAAFALSHNGDSEDAADKTLQITINEPTDTDSDGRPEISGSSNAPDATVTITLPDGSVITTQTDSQGNWSAEAPNSQPNGQLVVTVTDQAGNEASAAIDFIDNVAPQPPNVTVNDDEQLAGKAEPNATVVITDPVTGEKTTTVADDEGNWQVEPNPVSEGETNEITVIDPAGNASETIIVERPDVTPPDNITSGLDPESLSLLDDVDPVTGVIADGGVTNDTQPTYSGKATNDIASVNIYDNGKLVASVAVEADGSWSFTPETDLADGSAHTYTAAAVDKAGNIGPQIGGTADDGWDFTIDATAPDNETSGIVRESLVLTDDVDPVTGVIADGGVTNDKRPTYSGKATSDIATVNIYDNGELVTSVAVEADGSWSFTPDIELTDGSAHTYTAAAVDKAGNIGPQIGGTADNGWDFTIDATAPEGDASFVAGSITLLDDVGAVQGPIADGGATDDSQPEYKGVITAEALKSGVKEVAVYDAGVEIGRAEVDQTTGEWSFTPSIALASGAHGFTVAAVDFAGNVGPQVSGTDDESWDFSLLIGAPAAPAIESLTDDVALSDGDYSGALQKGQATNDATPTLSGTAGAGLTVTVWATDSEGNRREVGSTTADKDGRWTVTTEALGEDGEYGLTATAENAAGVSSPETGGFPIVLDTTAPEAATADLLDDQGEVQGVIAAGGTTDDSAPLLEGKGEAGSTVTVYVDGEKAGSATVDENGDWSLQLTEQADGEHSLQTVITDAAGNETASDKVSFTVDTSAVEVSIGKAIDNAGSIRGAVANNGITDDVTPELQGKAQAGSVVTIRDEEGTALGTATAAADGSWSFVLPEQSEGKHSWTAEVTNSAGNKAQAGFTLTIDSTAPEAPIITAITDDVGLYQSPEYGVEKGGVTDDPTPTFSGTAEAGSTVTLYDGDRVLGAVITDEKGNWSYTPTTNLVEGAHSISVTATDEAGNESARSESWDFTLDISTETPTVAINDDTTLAGTAEPEATITVTLADGTTRETTADKDGNWSMENPLSPDDKEVTVTATDSAGNEASTLTDGPNVQPPDNETSGIIVSSITLTDDIDPITGTIADGGVTNDMRPTYCGKATSDIASVNIYDNGELVASVAVEADGSWSFTPEADLADGSAHQYSASAVNRYGQEGPQTSGTNDDGWDFTIDVTAPDGDASFVAGSITLLDDVGAVQGPIADGGATDDSQPEYKGVITAEALKSGVKEVAVYDAGVEIGRAEVDQTTGEWSFTPSIALASGAHGFTVAAVDFAGNVGPQVSGTDDESWDFSLLIGAPAAPAIESLTDDVALSDGDYSGALQKGQATNDATPTLSGTAGAGLTVTVWATDSEGNRREVGSTTADKDGRWTVTTEALGEDGEYGLTATAENAAGVSSPETGGFPIVLDTTAPEAATADLLDDQGEVQGVIAAGGTTDDSAPLLEGKGEAGSTVTVYVDGEKAGSATVDENGDWSLQLTEQADGEHSLQTVITDAAGNETASDKVSFTVDTSAVEVSIGKAIDNAGSIRGAVANNGITDDVTPELQGKAQAGSVVTIRDEEGTALGTATAAADGSWSFVLPEQSEGKHSWTAEVTNSAGNKAQAGFTLTIDSTAPEAPLVNSLSDDVGSIQFTSVARGNVTDDPTPTFSGTAEAGSTLTLYDNGKKLGSVVADEKGNWSYTPTTNLVEGAHSISVTATDEAGNQSEQSSYWNFVLDITAPGVGITQNSNESLGGLTEPGATVTVVDVNGVAHSTVANDSGRWLMVPNPLSTGEVGSIYATDPSGNQSEAQAFQGAALGSYGKLLTDTIQVNTTVAGNQENPSVARLSDGRIVVIWQGDGTSGYEVYMQMYEADGVTKVGFEQQVNQRTNDNQDSPQVAALADGGFIVVWESNKGGLDTSDDGVVARRYGADGQAVSDEFLVNQNIKNDQNCPGVAALPDGGYVITWVDVNTNTVMQRIYNADNTPATDEVIVASGTALNATGGPEMAVFSDGAHGGMYVTVWSCTGGTGDSSGTGVMGQIYGADGRPLGGAFQVNTTTDSSQNYPDVVTLADGSFVVVWDSSDSGANGSDIRAVHYAVDAATGQVKVIGTGDFIVNSYTSGKQYKPVVVALEDGGYLVVWGSEGGDGSGSAIYAQRFDAADNRLGREFLVNVTTDGNQGSGGDSFDVSHVLDATLMADGNVYISWQSDKVDGAKNGVESVIVDINAGYYSEFAVNTDATGDQTVSAVAALPDGGSIVVWQSASGDGAGTCIKGQLLDAQGMPLGGEFVINSTTAGDQKDPQVAVLANGDIQVVWSSPASGSASYVKGQTYTYSYNTDGEVTGVTAKGAEFNISSGGTATRQGEPEIVALDGGGYMVVWQAVVNSKWVVFGRQYDADGSPVSAETQLCETGMGTGLFDTWYPLPAVTQLSNGTLVISYTVTQSSVGYEVCYRTYDPATQALGEEVKVNQTQAGNQASASITALDNGNFIVTWDSTDNGGPDQSGLSVWGRLYDADGNALGGEFMVNTATANDQQMVRVVSRADGSFAAVYTSQTDPAPGANTFGIYVQFFDKNGNKVGQEMQVNQLTYGVQDEVDAAFIEGGQLLITWTDHGVGDGSGTAIKARLVDLESALGLVHETAAGEEPTLIDYQPAATVNSDYLAPNVGISVNNQNTLSGQTEAGATVTVTDANGKIYTAIADENGRWTIEPNPLGFGKPGTIFATDKANNAGDPVAIEGAALSGYDLLRDTVQVNTTVAGNQENPSVARLSDGRIVVIWQGDGTSGYEVYMQMYEADGVTKVGSEQQVNQRTNDNQDSPQVAALADGGFIVVWESNKGGLDTSDDGVVARRYGADGQAVSDEFLVNQNIKNDQNCPGVAALPDGGYVITWVDVNTNTVMQRIYNADNTPATDEVIVASGTALNATGGPEMAVFSDGAHGGMYVTVWSCTGGTGDSSGTGVMGQIYGADGRPLGGAFQVNTTTDSSQNYPDVVTLADGSFVVVWDSSDSGANGSDIRAVHYAVDAATGQVKVIGTGDFIVNSYTSGKQYKPVVVALEDGGYLVVWGSEGGDGSGSAIYAQRFDAADNRLGREFLVNVTTDGNQGSGGDSFDVSHVLDATLMADGNVYISWQSDKVDGAKNGVESVIVDINAGYYSEFAVNTDATGDQTVSAVAALPDGGSIVVWQSASGDGAGTCIKGQLLDAQGMPLGGEFVINSTTAGDQKDPQVAVLANGDIQVVWSSPASGSASYVKGQTYTYSYNTDGEVTGVTAKGAEFNISSGGTATRQGEPEIVALDGGGYMVVWQAVVNSKWVVFGRQYDADGSPVSAETQLCETGMGTGLFDTWYPLPAVTQLSNGTLVISYTVTQSSVGYEVCYRTYDPATQALGEEVKVNQTQAGNQASASITALDNGNFIVTWDSTDNGGPDQSGLSVWGRLYDADGNALGGEFMVNTATANDQQMVRVVSRADGSFAAVYTSQTDPAPGANTFGIYVQFFDKNGNKVGQEMQVNQLTYGVQDEVDAAFIEGGQLLITWTDHGVGDGSGTAIKARLVDLETTLGLSSDDESVTLIDYVPAQTQMYGTSEHDVLDARNAATVDAGEGDDTIVISSTNFTSINGGAGQDTLVWDSNNDLDLGSVSNKLSGIETIHMGNNAAQVLTIRPEDVLDITAGEQQDEFVLRITGDDGKASAEGAKDTVNLDLSLWTESAEAKTEDGVTWNVYVSNDDSTVKLMIQQGMNVI
ncbi:Ig-like domain-containing protein [Kalamiella sp. sgz302252]|uniref:Ig-like domain-containing protein n=1 Tax=Pantoea sp. sgz302252 TaxID=3341827 RepID=UPI0036D38120